MLLTFSLSVLPLALPLQGILSNLCFLLILGLNASCQSWFQTLICGLLGLPPSNGVLPQSPMHTKSLAVLKRQVGCRTFRNYSLNCYIVPLMWILRVYNPWMQLIRKKMVKSAKEGILQQASNSEIYGRMQAVFVEMDASPAVSTIGLYYGLSYFLYTHACSHI